MQPFGGFIMPIQYTSIIDEHNAVRNACGVFDVSHMGEVLVSGVDAERFVNHIFTNDVAGMPLGKILYGMMCYENGGVVDDLLVYKRADHCFLLVINAANIDKDLQWIEEQAQKAEKAFNDLQELLKEAKGTAGQTTALHEQLKAAETKANSLAEAAEEAYNNLASQQEDLALPLISCITLGKPPGIKLYATK